MVIMKKVKYIIFRYLTSADFFNIYKPSGTEVGGGGQSYIDFPTKSISVDSWGEFFDNASSVFCSSREQGPSWEFPIKSIGLQSNRDVLIYQRRPQSICISSQKITSQQENRVDAWRPENNFPQPNDPNDRDTDISGLFIFLVRTSDNEFWAGWSQSSTPATPAAEPLIADMLAIDREDGYAGFLKPTGPLILDPTDEKTPFKV